MIDLKLSSIGGESAKKYSLKVIQGRTLKDAVLSAVEPLNLKDFPIEEAFQVLHNGHRIESSDWHKVRLATDDQILIAPIMQGSDSSSFVRAAIVIAIVAASGGTAFKLLGPGTFAAGLATAGISVAASALAYALIPPAAPEPIRFDAGSSPYSSQTYRLSGQSNQVKKYGSVHKVYGTHRVFPTVAANPYTELSIDPETKDFASYLYAIYDLGLGPAEVGEIKIGETPISEFADLDYRLVDLNKPTVSTGPWDDALNPSFELYKGDRAIEPVGVQINYNQQGSTIGPDNYQVTRVAKTNTNNVSQEIVLSFVNPSGLYALAADGSKHARKIVLQIEFAKVGTENWLAYNNFEYVSSWDAVGGDTDYGLLSGPAYIGPYSTNYLTNKPPFSLNYLTQLYFFQPWSLGSDPFGLNPQPTYTVTKSVGYGYRAGAQSLVLNTANAQVGNYVYYNNKYVGRIASFSFLSSPLASQGFYGVNLVDPIQEDLQVAGFSWVETYISGGPFQYANLIPNNDSANSFKVRKDILSRAQISSDETSVKYSQFRFTPKEIGNYKVRVTRISTTSAHTFQTQDDLLWESISTNFDGDPIKTTQRHVFLELRIRATNQLNGVIGNLSAICSSVLDVYDPDTETWSKEVSRNPAWIFADIMTGEVNKKAISKDRLHLDSLVEWAEFCDQIPGSTPNFVPNEPRFSSDFVLDYQTTVQGLINQITSASQASLNLIDGKYGVLIDKLKTTPVQIFTPRNSRNFSSVKNFPTRPHALKVSYIDPGLDWAVAEAIVYDDGYTELNATVFEDFGSFACTSYEQAWRLGRFMMAQNRLRQEIMTIEVDFEHLVCTRGDYVKITQDVMKVGGYPARVVSKVGSQIKIDDGLELPIASYGYTYRNSSTGAILTGTLTVNTADTFTLAGPGALPSVGDLIVIGEVSKITYDCLVKTISPNSDLSATLTLVEKADAVYTAETGAEISSYDPQISYIFNPDITPPGPVQELVVVDNAYACNGGDYLYYIDIDWNDPVGSAYETFEVYSNDGRGLNLSAVTKLSSYRYVVDPTRLGNLHTFKVIAVSATGNKLDLGSAPTVTATPLLKTTPPSDVESLAIDITGETLQLFWPEILDCDRLEYRVRYNPTLTGTWQNSIPLMNVSANTTLATTQARTGTYLVKAVDFNGNESALEAIAITTIPELFNLNVIDEITDAPTWLGPKETVSIVGGALQLQESVSGSAEDVEYFSEGFYYYDSLLDLGEIFTVRLQSLINAEGLRPQDLMINWATLSAVSYLSTAGSAQWDVETQYRTTDNFIAMVSWSPLADVTFLNSGDKDSWTEWKKFVIGDATGRIFQFRLKLISYVANVSPRVFDGTIRADMPDRVEAYNNMYATTSGLTVVYAPAFKGPSPSPAVQISMDDAASGDYWEFTNKDLEGFTIKFYDKNDLAVARTFDAQIKGFGRQNDEFL